MKNEPFDKTDKSLMEGLKELREKKVPPVYLKGFSASVERKIRSREEKAERPFSLRGWAPVMAVLILAVFIVSRNPAGNRPLPTIPQMMHFASTTLTGQDLTEEIALLAELGEWSEEEDSDWLGTSAEAELEALEK